MERLFVNYYKYFRLQGGFPADSATTFAAQAGSPEVNGGIPIMVGAKNAARETWFLKLTKFFGRGPSEKFVKITRR